MKIRCIVCSDIIEMTAGERKEDCNCSSHREISCSCQSKGLSLNLTGLFEHEGKIYIRAWPISNAELWSYGKWIKVRRVRWCCCDLLVDPENQDYHPHIHSFSRCPDCLEYSCTCHKFRELTENEKEYWDKKGWG